MSLSEPYGQRFLFETGEMIPTTLTQLIKEIGEENIGINFDCANMIINARANSVDALTILAPLGPGRSCQGCGISCGNGS